ncbi:MAG: hypothetical protein IK014_02265 [Lachnospiraceae bacterium]|nr:hypothetical protein [Lachnospiraceae bacterium]
MGDAVEPALKKPAYDGMLLDLSKYKVYPRMHERMYISSSRVAPQVMDYLSQQ